MRTQFSKLALMATLALALALTLSCSSGDDGNNNSGTSSPSGGGNENSQVYNEGDGTPFTGSGAIVIRKTSINAGSVTNGIVNLELPQTLKLPQNVADKYFNDFLDADEQRSCSNYPNGIKAFIEGIDFIQPNITRRKEMYIYYRDGQLMQGIEHWYFSIEGKVVCNLVYEDDVLNVNLDVKKGWNKIYVVTDRNGRKMSTDNILTKEVKWFVED